MLFNKFVHKYALKQKATSDMETQNILSSLSLSDMKIFLRNGPFSKDLGICNLHPSKIPHFYGCSLPNKLSKFVIKQNGNCLYSE